jgi:hypothetical protein
MTERKPPGMSFETWVESQISQGLARGDFDDLPGAGKPLPPRSEDETAYDWVVQKARRENLDLYGMLPPGLRLRKEREDLPGVVVRLPTEAAVRALVEDFNARVQAHWRRPQLSADVVPGLADLHALVAHWRATRPPVVEVREPPPTPSAPRRRWWRRRSG